MKTARTITRWGLVLAGGIGPIVAGCEGAETYRTSTPLVEFDPGTLTGTTASGRPYRLVGAADPAYALKAFLSLWNPENAEVRVVDPEEAVRLIAENGNTAFAHVPEQQAELDLRKLRFVADRFRSMQVLMGIDEAEAARLAGLTEDQLRGLLDADLKAISADEADAAYFRLAEEQAASFRRM